MFEHQIESTFIKDYIYCINYHKKLVSHRRRILTRKLI